MFTSGIYGTIADGIDSFSVAFRDDGAIVGRNSGEVFNTSDIPDLLTGEVFVTVSKAAKAARDAAKNGVRVNLISESLVTAAGNPTTYAKALSAKAHRNVFDHIDHYAEWGGIEVETAEAMKAAVLAFYADEIEAAA